MRGVRRRTTTLSRVFSGLSITRRPSESVEEKRGDLGLNLVCNRTDPIADIVEALARRGARGMTPPDIGPKSGCGETPISRG